MNADKHALKTKAFYARSFEFILGQVRPPQPARMLRMSSSPGGFRTALLAGWVALSAAGIIYARFKNIPNWAAFPILAAFLLEYPFYLATGFPAVRERLAGWSLAAYILASTLLPYLVSCYGTGLFQWSGLVRLAALAGVLSLWYVVLPAAPLYDLAFLALIAAVLLGGYFNRVYRPPVPGADVQVLGHLALIQSSVMMLLSERRVNNAGYGFLPARSDWRIGLTHYLYFLPIGFPLALGLHVIRFGSIAPLWRTAAVFLGVLWVVALSEEFFFRGVLQKWIEEWTRGPLAALLLTSALYGLAHLWFRGFPNWRYALVAMALGFFCGRARNQAGSIRAGMVTHALVVTTWRALFV